MDFNNPNFEVIPTKDLSHAEWFDLRRKYLCGSDLAAIMEMSQYATPTDIFLEKTWQTPTETEETPIMRRGHILEPIVINEHKLRHPNDKIIIPPGMFVSKEWPWMGGNFDGIIIINREPGVGEIKTIGWPGEDWGPDGGNEDDMPERVSCQTFHYMAVSKFKYAVVIALLVAAWEIRRYFIWWDDSVIQNVVAIGKRFWNNHVIPQVPPTPTNSMDCNKLWKWDKGTTIVAEDDIIEIAFELKAVREEAKRLVGSDGRGGRKSELEAKIKSYMRDNQVLIGPDGKKICSWKTQTARHFRAKEFAETYPELDKEFRKESTSRVFRLK